MAVKKDQLEDVRIRLKDERMDQVEVHLKKYGVAIENISNALIGNELNGKKGLVHEVSNLKKNLDELKDEYNERKLIDAKKDKYTGRLEASFGICLTVLVGMMFKFIFT